MKLYVSLLRAINYSKHKNLFSFIFFFTIVILLSYVMMTTYYSSDIFRLGYDSTFHLKRFLSLKNAFDSGTFPFYIDYLSMGQYGYATNLFYPDLFLIPFALLIDKLGIIEAYKIMLFSFFVICAILSYLSVWEMFKQIKISIVFSLLYTFSFYHLTLLGARNGLGEIIACAFIPLVCWGTYEIIYGDYQRRWYIICIGFSCLILSHLLTAFIVFLVLIIYLLVYYKAFWKEPKRILYLAVAGILSIFLCAYFLFPFLEQTLDNSYYYQTHPAFTNMLERQVSLRRIIIGMFSGLVFSEFDSISIGITLILPLFLRLFINKKNKLISFADISMILGFLLLLTPSEYFPWDMWPFSQLSIIQFPERFLNISSILFAFSGSIYIYTMSPHTKSFISTYFIIIFLLFLFIKVEGGIFQGYKTGHGYYQKNQDMDFKTYYMGGGNEYLPSSLPSVEYIQQRGAKTIETSHDNAEIAHIIRNGAELNFEIKTVSTANVTLPLLYYKGYQATLNGEKLVIQQNDKGLIQLTVPQSGRIKVYFKGTSLQRSALVISLFSLLGLIIYIVYTYRNQKNYERTKNNCSYYN